jgi:hypothetical protein
LKTFESFESDLYNLNDQSFNDIALSLFRFQAENNKIYRQYIESLSIKLETIRDIEQVPYLPISFFKNHDIKTGSWVPQSFFTSSGTTDTGISRHLVYNLNAYKVNAKRCFEAFFGDLSGYHFLALLPSYLERKDSSLVSMMDYFIQQDATKHSGFYLRNEDTLLKDIEILRAKKEKKIILWGVSFALLDLIENYKPDLSDCIIIETGGMKGRRREITRYELHTVLAEAFGVAKIHSEYGMTELFSQAYTKGGDRFYCPPTVKVIAREVTDPLRKGIIGETGGLNVIDLANIHSAAFIETEDLGKVHSDGSFEVLGRIDNTDARGCNLLIG